MNELPLVSIIMPAYNASKFIDLSIDSVLSQTYTNWELLVIDDCSTDDTQIIVNKYQKLDDRIKYILMEVNSGSPSAPRNKGLREAVGEYIAFLDADDLWFDEKLEKHINFMTSNNYKFTCSAYNIISEAGNKISSYTPECVINHSMMQKNNSVGCLTAVIHRAILEESYFPSCGHEDYALWLKLVRKTGEIYSIQEVLASYRKVNNSISSNKVKVVKFFWHIYRNEENFNIFKSFRLCFGYFVNALWFKYK